VHGDSRFNDREKVGIATRTGTPTARWITVRAYMKRARSFCSILSRSPISFRAFLLFITVIATVERAIHCLGVFLNKVLVETEGLRCYSEMEKVVLVLLRAFEASLARTTQNSSRDKTPLIRY
jgi:hypothetical protein